MTKDELIVADNICKLIFKVAEEINKLTIEVIKLNERIEDATCYGGRKLK